MNKICLDLVAPDWAGVDRIWKSPKPFVLWPVCGEPLLAYWLDEGVRRQVERIRVFATDRPHVIRAWIQSGNYWSREIHVEARDGAEIEAAERMDRLPGQPVADEVRTAQDLMERWFELQSAALALRQSGRLAIDREISTGIWIGPSATIHPTAKLEAPCWIGERASIEAKCRIGPHAFVGQRSFVDEDAEIDHGIVCADSYVGRHTRLHRAAVQGGLLMDWRRGVGIQVLEDFILADLKKKDSHPPFGERLAALLLYAMAAPLRAWSNRGQKASVREAQLPGGSTLELKTWPRGPLIVRRCEWLREVAAGRLRIIGVLPRTPDEWELLDPEVRNALRTTPAGVLTLSDLYDCHSPSQPDEWLHAAYQSGAEGGAGVNEARKSALRIAMKTPLDDEN